MNEKRSSAESVLAERARLQAKQIGFPAAAALPGLGRNCSHALLRICTVHFNWELNDTSLHRESRAKIGRYVNGTQLKSAAHSYRFMSTLDIIRLKYSIHVWEITDNFFQSSAPQTF